LRSRHWYTLATAAWALALVAASGPVSELWLNRQDLRVPVFARAQHGYWIGLSEGWSYDDAKTYRMGGRRLGAEFPSASRGGQLEIDLMMPRAQSAELTVSLDDHQARIRIPPREGPQTLSIPLPERVMRTRFRIRLSAGEAGDTLTPVDDELPEVYFAEARWVGSRLTSGPRLRAKTRWLLVGSMVLAVALGVSLAWSAAWSALVIGVSWLASGVWGFATPHWVLESTPMLVALVLSIGLIRWRWPSTPRALLVTFLGLFVVRYSLVMAPSYWFYDIQVQETLVELIYHRGLIDYVSRLPEYQITYSLGVTEVAGTARAFPYSIVLHGLVHVGNLLWHAPTRWLMLSNALLASLALFPVAWITHRLTASLAAATYAGIAYASIPALTRSVLLLENASTWGRFVDLIVIACLAGITMRVDSVRRFTAVALLIGLALASYTAGFVHFGLLIGVVLAMALIERRRFPLSRGQCLALAGAALTGLALSLACYHPQTVRNLFSAVAPAGLLEEPTHDSRGLSEILFAAASRLRVFLGLPVLGFGSLGVLWLHRHLRGRPVRVLVSAWAASSLLAYGMRFAFVDLFLKQKELYWAGALLAIGAGWSLVELERRLPWWRPWMSHTTLAGFAIPLLWALGDYQIQFFGPYLFR